MVRVKNILTLGLLDCEVVLSRNYTSLIQMAYLPNFCMLVGDYSQYCEAYSNFADPFLRIKLCRSQFVLVLVHSWIGGRTIFC